MPGRTLDQRDKLVRQATILEATLDAMDQGISVVDVDLNVIVFNRRFLEILDLPADRFRPGDSFETFVRFNAERGEYGPGDVEEQVRERVALARTFAPHCFERTRPDGTIIEIKGTPLPGGGLLTTYTDVSERKQSERRALEEALDAARVRLNATLESVSSGIGLFDKDDRLVLFNRHYREVYPGLADVIREGASFEQILTTAAERGIVADAAGRRETWFQERMARHRNPAGAFQQRQADGRWVQIDERRTADGGIVSVFTDVSELKRREEDLAGALKEKDALLAEFNTVMDTIEYGVMFLGPDLRVRLTNRAYRDMWHFSDEYLAGNPEVEDMIALGVAQGRYAVPKGEEQDFVRQRTEAIRHGNIAPMDLPMADGRTFEFQCLSLPDGGRMNTYFDITAYRRAEEELAAAICAKDALLAEFNTVMDTIEYGVLFLGPDLRMRLANRAFGKMWHFPSELIAAGRATMRELMEFVAAQGLYPISADEAESYFERRLEAIRQGDIAPVDLRMSDGRVVEYQCKSLPDGGRMITYFDITAYRRAEEALKENEQRFKDFTSSSSDWTWEMGPDLRFTFAAERMLSVFHIGPEDVIGKTRQEVGQGDLDDEAWRRHLEDLDARRPFKNFRYPLTAAGETRWISTSGLPLFAADGSFLGYRGTASDVTAAVQREQELREAKERAERALADLKQAQTNLVHAEKLALLGQLVAGIAHEIKNPLNFVNNFAGLSIELLEEMRAELDGWLLGLDAERRADVEDLITTLKGNLGKIREHGDRADGIVKSMLAHSREGPGEKRPADVNALIEESLGLAYHGARAQDGGFNATLERELDPAAGAVEMVPQDISRVLLNLFSNGFHAIQERLEKDTGADYRPVVRVSSRRVDGAVEIRVRDNGIGIPADVAQKIFTPFYTTKPAGKGTGLGLSLSYDIVVHQHGGNFDVDTRPGEYAEFIVRLPCTTMEARHEPQPSRR